MSLSGYQVGGGGAVSSAASSTDDKPTKGYWSLEKLKRAYLDYLGTKREEIDEQQDARRYRHGSHWTAEQIKQLNLRKQPVSWENIVGRKVHGIVGTLERLKQDPKAYARTPKHEEGAELATACLRYVLDEQEWDAKDPICSEMAAVDGIGGLELNLVEGDKGDREIELEVVFVDSFVYDPRSYRHDFSDARYMGVGKWLDLDSAIELYPDSEEDLEDSLESGTELTSDPDREQKWFHSYGEVKRVRVVELWYRHKGKWCYCVFTGETKLMEGESYLVDEKGQTECKYLMFSAYVDQDGDRYGVVRDLKPLNQEVDMRKSKALYTMLSRRIIAPNGAFDDIEVARREAARSDGVVIYNLQGDAKPEFDDSSRMAETNAQFQFYESARTAIESFGPNVAVTGEGLENSSGRAIHLLQQAGLADLGPFIQSYRAWKIRLYRMVWNAIQKHWSGERWIRVTDDDDISQFIQINGMQVDPETGMPGMVNQIGSLDVDIILDEGADTVNSMADAYDTLTVLAGKGTEIPPAVLIELAPLPMSVKKKILDMLNPQQPDPKEQMREQVEMQMGVETVKEKAASAQLKQAQAQKTMREAAVVQPEQAEMGQPGDHPMKVQTEAMEKQASAAQKVADAEKKRAETDKIRQDIQLEPQRMMMEQHNTEHDRMMQAHESEQGREMQAKDSDRNFEVNKMKAKQKPAPRKA